MEKIPAKRKLVKTYSCGAQSAKAHTNGVIAPLYSLRSLPRVKTRGY